MISCCGKYRECSNQRFCINPKHKSKCNYSKKLEDGHNFYDKEHLNRLYVLVDGSCYAISRRNKVNILFEPDSDSKELIKEKFDKLGIAYLEQYEFALCHAEKTSAKNPAYWEVRFGVGDNSYVIRNFNIRMLTEEKAKAIHKHLSEKGLRPLIYTRANSTMLSEIRAARSNTKTKNIVIVTSVPADKSNSKKSPGSVKEKSKAEQSRLIVEDQIDMFGLMAHMGS